MVSRLCLWKPTRRHLKNLISLYSLFSANLPFFWHLYKYATVISCRSGKTLENTLISLEEPTSRGVSSLTSLCNPYLRDSFFSSPTPTNHYCPIGRAIFFKEQQRVVPQYYRFN
jgi:hypothetical protein